MPLTSAQNKQAELAAREGIIVQCRKGCSACCGQEVRLFKPEEIFIISGLKSLSSDLIQSIRERTEGWLRWQRDELPNYKDICVSQAHAFFQHGPPCPLLNADGLCDLYSSRPLDCRLYSSITDARTCLPKRDPNHLDTQEAALSISSEAMKIISPFYAMHQRMGGVFTEQGKFLPTLPEFIAKEMGWGIE